MRSHIPVRKFHPRRGKPPACSFRRMSPIEERSSDRPETLHVCSGDHPDSIGSGSPRIGSTSYFGASWGRRLVCLPPSSSFSKISSLNSDSVVGIPSRHNSATVVGSLSRPNSATVVGSLSRQNSASVVGSLSPQNSASVVGSLSRQNSATVVGSLSRQNSATVVGSLSRQNSATVGILAEHHH